MKDYFERIYILQTYLRILKSNKFVENTDTLKVRILRLILGERRVLLMDIVTI